MRTESVDEGEGSHCQNHDRSPSVEVDAQEGDSNIGTRLQAHTLRKHCVVAIFCGAVHADYVQVVEAQRCCETCCQGGIE